MGAWTPLSPPPPERASPARRGMRPETGIGRARRALARVGVPRFGRRADVRGGGVRRARARRDGSRDVLRRRGERRGGDARRARATPASRRDRTSTGVAPSDTASRRRDWSLDETFECAALAAHTLTALADADPDGRYDLVAVPHALDALLSLLETSRETAADGETRARRHRDRDRDCSSSRRRACAAAAAAALFRLAPEPATAAALACRPDAIAALARLARDDETSDETACSALGVLWVTTRGPGGTSWAPLYVAPGGGSGSGASTPRGGGSVGGWTSTRFHGPVSTARDAPHSSPRRSPTNTSTTSPRRCVRGRRARWTRTGKTRKATRTGKTRTGKTRKATTRGAPGKRVVALGALRGVVARRGSRRTWRGRHRRAPPRSHGARLCWRH